MTKIRPRPRALYAARGTRSSNGITRISRRSSGGNSPPRLRKASMCVFSLCSIGRRSTSGATSSARKFRSRKCIFREMASDFVRLSLSPITMPIESNASTIDEIIAELETTKTSERAGRAQDHHERNAMQKLRAKGNKQTLMLNSRQHSQEGCPASEHRVGATGDPAQALCLWVTWITASRR